MEINDLRSNLDRIRKLTETVVPLIEISHVDKNRVIYDVHQGECHGIGLLKNEEVAVQNAYLGVDTILKNHEHEEVEVLIVYEGTLNIKMEDGDEVISTGEVIVIKPGFPHIAKSKTGCKLIAVTIPAANGYPNGENK